MRPARLFLMNDGSSGVHALGARRAHRQPAAAKPLEGLTLDLEYAELAAQRRQFPLQVAAYLDERLRVRDEGEAEARRDAGDACEGDENVAQRVVTGGVLGARANQRGAHLALGAKHSECLVAVAQAARLAAATIDHDYAALLLDAPENDALPSQRYLRLTIAVSASKVFQSVRERT